MDKLQEQTKFTKKELQVLYRGFKNVGVAAAVPGRTSISEGGGSWLEKTELRLELMIFSKIPLSTPGVSKRRGERGEL